MSIKQIGIMLLILGNLERVVAPAGSIVTCGAACSLGFLVHWNPVVFDACFKSCVGVMGCGGAQAICVTACGTGFLFHYNPLVFKACLTSCLSVM